VVVGVHHCSQPHCTLRSRVQRDALLMLRARGLLQTCHHFVHALECNKAVCQDNKENSVKRLFHNNGNEDRDNIWIHGLLVDVRRSRMLMPSSTETLGLFQHVCPTDNMTHCPPPPPDLQQNLRSAGPLLFGSKVCLCECCQTFNSNLLRCSVK
jgi:hypothetical protein